MWGEASAGSLFVGPVLMRSRDRVATAVVVAVAMLAGVAVPWNVDAQPQGRIRRAPLAQSLQPTPTRPLRESATPTPSPSSTSTLTPTPSMTASATSTSTPTPTPTLAPSRVPPTTTSTVAAAVPLPRATLAAAPAGDGTAALALNALLAGGFLETWDGQPSSPQPWKPADWDVTIFDNDAGTPHQLEVMDAHHGTDCASPPALHRTSGSFDDAVFLCSDHLMTAMYAGYGAIALTPPVLVDFTSGEAIVRWDMSTLRTENRDWVEVWLTPWGEDLQLNGNDGQSPRNGIAIVLGHTMDHPIWFVNVWRDGVPVRYGRDEPSYATFLTPSASRRDTFELRVSRTHLRFGMPAYNQFWTDQDIPALPWTMGAVQLSHHSYSAGKDCPGMVITPGVCGPDTWHWDNLSLSPAVPFTILRADRRYVDKASPQVVRFPQGAPPQAFLRFGMRGSAEVSFDGGATWRAPGIPQPPRVGFDEYSTETSIPAGVQEVRFRSPGGGTGNFLVRDISIWSQAAPGDEPLPTLTPLPTFTAAPPTMTATSSSTPAAPTTTPAAPTASPTEAPSSTPLPTGTPEAKATVVCVSATFQDGVLTCVPA